MMTGYKAMRNFAVLTAATALALLQMPQADAWMRGGATFGGGHWGAAAGGGHWAAGANGHYGSGTYGTTSSGTRYATSSRGGSAEASNGSWSSQSASGRTNSGSYGTTAYGTHYATGSYGGAVATNNGHWAAENNGQYAYGTRYSGATVYGGAYHPPAVVNQYYGTGCYNCGGWGGGAAVAAGVAGVAVGAAVGAAAANAAVANSAYAPGDVYAALPYGCGYAPYAGMAYYNCGGTWFVPGYGANGLYYRVVPPP
jgi:hypothetical protein